MRSWLGIVRDVSHKRWLISLAAAFAASAVRPHDCAVDTLMNESAFSIKPLTRETLPLFLRFFDGEAFSDNPQWSFCYCQCFYEDHRQVKWSQRTAEENRTYACDRTQSGRMQGYIACEGLNPIGWCGAAPRGLFHALDDEPLPESESVGAIVCFLVAPRHRGKGVARLLLRAACTGLRNQGMAIAEAYPRTNPTTAAENHFRPLALYLSEGFTVHREDADGSVCVRYRL